MAGAGKKQKSDRTGRDGASQPPRKPIEDDDEEDGDIATPKRDRSGEDDQPL